MKSNQCDKFTLRHVYKTDDNLNRLIVPCLVSGVYMNTSWTSMHVTNGRLWWDAEEPFPVTRHSRYLLLCLLGECTYHLCTHHSKCSYCHAQECLQVEIRLGVMQKRQIKCRSLTQNVVSRTTYIIFETTFPSPYSLQISFFFSPLPYFISFFCTYSQCYAKYAWIPLLNVLVSIQ